MVLGPVDEIEIEHELRDAEGEGKQMLVAAEPQPRADRRRIEKHRRAGDDEAVGHRPGRRHPCDGSAPN